MTQGDAMQCLIVHNEQELDAACATMAQKKMRLGAMSTAGLPSGTWRATFLPEDVFLRPGEQNPPPKIPRCVEEWLREIVEPRLARTENEQPE